jgi:RES domain-containing protein
LTFSPRQQAAIRKWASRAPPLKGLYFRSVEYRYMDPNDVLSGAGTEAYGGRFAPVGTRAVYLSATDSGAGKEVTARKARLGGAAQINTSKYPRIVYAVAVRLDRTLDLSDLRSSEPEKAIVNACLSLDDLTASMDLARVLEMEGIQGLAFPSVIAGGDDNLIVYLSNCAAGSLTLQNEQEIIEQAKRMVAKHQKG